MSWLGAGFELFGEHILWPDLVGDVVSLAVATARLERLEGVST